MARSVVDLWLALKVLLGNAGGETEFEESHAAIRDFREIELGKLRVGFYTQLGWLTPAPAIERAVLEAVASLQSDGVHVEPFEPPDVHDAMRLYFSMFYADAMQFMKRDLQSSVVDRDVRKYLALTRIPTFLRPLISAAYGWAGQRAMSQSLHYLRKRVLSAPEYLQLRAEQDEYRNRFVAAMNAAGLDALICPPSPVPAIRHDEFYANFSLIFTSLYNLLAMPAGVVAATRVQPDEESRPRGNRDCVERCFTRIERGSAGLPVGVQVVSRWWKEEVALAVMHQLENHFRSTTTFPGCPPTPA